VAVVAAYFPWAKATGNFRPEFAMPLDELKRFDGPMLVLQTCIASFYMTAFFLPALLLFRWGTRVPRLLAFAAVGVVLVGGAYYAMRVAEAAGISNAKPADVHHKVMPFDGNVLYNAGIGPLTLKDAYFFEVPRPTWPVERWKVIQWILVAAAAAWVPVVGWTASALRALKGKPGWELMMHGLLFAAGEFLLTVQASKFYVWDRYYIPCVLGLALFLPVLIQVTREREGAAAPPRPLSLGLFAAALLPVALYTVLGLHDQFRWNEVRWSLVRKALDMGASTGNIDGGYEVTGWINQDDFQAGRMPPSCLGPCACAMDWYCSDGSYMLTFVRLPGYDVVASEQPDYWLANGPPMLLLRRWPDYDRR